MSLFGSDYSWRNTMGTITCYVLRRILGAVARVLDRVERRERECRRNLRAHPEGGRRARH